jgi:hypothetical protein
MERLRNQLDSGDPLLAEAARLARSAEVVAPPPYLREKIHARLRRPAVRRSLWRPALAIGALVIAMSVASAKVMHWLRAARPIAAGSSGLAPSTVLLPPAPEPLGPSAPSPTNVTSPSAFSPKKVTAKTRVSRPKSTAPSEPFDPAPLMLAEPVEPEPTREPEAMVSPSTVEVVPPKPAVANPDPEAILVLSATRALRDGDSKRALKLLDEYVRRYPSGDLLAESLALTIEARSVRGDKRAGEAARQYLQRFPNGRFADIARTAMKHFGGSLP